MSRKTATFVGHMFDGTGPEGLFGYVLELDPPLEGQYSFDTVLGQHYSITVEYCVKLWAPLANVKHLRAEEANNSNDGFTVHATNNIDKFEKEFAEYEVITPEELTTKSYVRD